MISITVVNPSTCVYTFLADVKYNPTVRRAPFKNHQLVAIAVLTGIPITADFWLTKITGVCEWNPPAVVVCIRRALALAQQESLLKMNAIKIFDFEFRPFNSLRTHLRDVCAIGPVVQSGDVDDGESHLSRPRVHDRFDRGRKDDTFFIRLLLKRPPKIFLHRIPVRTNKQTNVLSQ